MIRTTAELLRFEPESGRTAAFFAALAQAAPRAGVQLTTTTRYAGRAPWLLLWGPGAPDRRDPMREQLAAGGHVAAFDLAYWDRARKLRVSIDGAHPQRWVMRRDWPPRRARLDRVLPTGPSVWNPTGPVIVAGIGEKATVQYGPAVHAWELEMIGQAAARGVPLRYRPKKLGPVPAGVRPAGAGPIEQVVRGASLVITWHSNVAVDAIRLGLPVVCRDGAAAAVCPSVWVEAPQPLAQVVRDRFLANLAWFQWSQIEAAACWNFLLEVVDA